MVRWRRSSSQRLAQIRCIAAMMVELSHHLLIWNQEEKRMEHPISTGLFPVFLLDQLLAKSDPLYCNCYCIVKPRCTDWSHSLTPSAQPLALIWNQGTPRQKPNKPPKICSILQIQNATFVILLHHSNSPTSSAQPSWVHDVDSYMEPGRVDVTPNIYMLSARLKNILKKKLECVFDLHSQTLNSLISLCLHFWFFSFCFCSSFSFTLLFNTPFCSSAQALGCAQVHIFIAAQ